MNKILRKKKPEISSATQASGLHRPWYALGTLVATTIAAVFWFIGDGVSKDASGIAGWILEYAHTLVWVLLAVAFLIATVRGTWARLAGAFALAAAIVYVTFLITLFVGQ